MAIDEEGRPLPQEKYKQDEFDDKWEEVPDEDLWEDGELNSVDVAKKIYWAVIQQGEWKLIRRKDDK